MYKIAIEQSFTAASTVIEDELCSPRFRKLLNKCMERDIITPKENIHIVHELEQLGKSVAVLKFLEIFCNKSENDVDEFIIILNQQKLVSLANFIEEMIETVKHVKKLVKNRGMDPPEKDKQKQMMSMFYI